MEILAGAPSVGAFAIQTEEKSTMIAFLIVFLVCVWICVWICFFVVLWNDTIRPFFQGEVTKDD